MLIELDTDAMLRTVANTTITDEQRRKAISAVVSRYQREDWSAGELRQVVDMLGLRETEQARKHPLVLRRIVGVVDHGTVSTVRLSCGHLVRREMRRGDESAICEECTNA